MISPETAYRAAYLDSGVMTIIVNQDDIVYEKDLGKNTAEAAKDLKSATLIPLGDARTLLSSLRKNTRPSDAATAKSALFVPK